MTLFVVISGCSGGGKSTLIGELARRGHVVVEEAGRRVVEQVLASGGSALPWIDAEAFARRTLASALTDRQAAALVHAGRVFFDRGLVDAATALHHAGGDRVDALLAGMPRYHRKVFLALPWREIYVGDPARRLGFDEGVAEYERLADAYPRLGYEVATLPRTDARERADFVLAALAE